MAAQSQLDLKPSFTIRVNASRGEKGPPLYGRVKSHSRRNHQSVEDELKLRKEQHLQKRAKQCEQLEENLVSSHEFLQALDAKECVLEVQAGILGKLAAEENLLMEASDVPGVEVTLAKFTERVEGLEVLREGRTSVATRRCPPGHTGAHWGLL
jgi:hypothetical protein